jgi:hypothetical protein
MAETLAARRQRLTAEIADARARLTQGEDFEWAEIGDLLDALSQELTGVTHLEEDDDAAARAGYDEVERKLAEARARVDRKTG